MHIGGTASVQSDGTVCGEGDAYLRTRYVLEKLIKLIETAGFPKSQVIRVKVYAGI